MTLTRLKAYFYIWPPSKVCDCFMPSNTVSVRPASLKQAKILSWLESDLFLFPLIKTPKWLSCYKLHLHLAFTYRLRKGKKMWLWSPCLSTSMLPCYFKLFNLNFSKPKPFKKLEFEWKAIGSCNRELVLGKHNLAQSYNYDFLKILIEYHLDHMQFSHKFSMYLGIICLCKWNKLKITFLLIVKEI